ncbi:hypothetical protein ES703_36159 [subsurface metagenome]
MCSNAASTKMSKPTGLLISNATVTKGILDNFSFLVREISVSPVQMKQNQKEQFQQLARKKRSNIVSEFFFFLKHNKKWWLLPIIITLLILGLLVLLGGTALAPFIYPLF